MSYISLFLGIVLGGLIGFLIAFLFISKKGEKISIALSNKNIEFNNLEKKLNEDASLREDLEKRFTETFENLANNVLEKKSSKFIKQNRMNLDDILLPLKEKIKDFQVKVENAHQDTIERNATLVEKIQSLEKISMQMSTEANKLSKALKGESKTQGNWGEMILERILEESGLRKDEEYYSQASGIKIKNDEDKKLKPDVVIKLPENKHLIIDSKVSLVSYEAYSSSETEDERINYANNLVSSIRTHVVNLSQKHYQTGKDINSPDFVLMFMPIEASFSVALQIDKQLFQYAWDRKIMIVTPTTLMATLWTISSIWRQENQTKNAMEIARQGGALYDKFVLFIDTFVNIGSSIDKLRLSFDTAYNQLKTGKGNLISRVEKLRKMGIVPKKKLNPNITEVAIIDSGDSEEDIEDTIEDYLSDKEE